MNLQVKYKFVHFLYLLTFEWIPKIKFKYEILRYRFLEYLDPSPPKKEGKERDSDWYKRIDYKYAKRHARMSFNTSAYLNKMFQMTIEEGATNKKLLRLAREISVQFYNARQNYQELLNYK